MDLAGTPAIPGPENGAPLLRQRAGEVRVLSAAEASTPAFVAAWEALTERATEPNPFFEPWFAQASLNHFANDAGVSLFTFNEGGRLTGLLPISNRQPYYGYRIPHIAAWLHHNAFCGAPLIASGAECAFWRALLGHLDHTSRRALFLHLPQMPADGLANAALDAVIGEGSRFSATVEESERAMLASDLGAEDYLAGSMSTKKRKELRRQHKRLGEEGTLTFERSNTADDIDVWIADFLALEAAGWKGEAGSALASDGDTRAFFTAALSSAHGAGRLERLTMRLDGRAIAMLANFVTPPGVFSFKTAFDEDYARFSPGLLLQIENLDILSREDIQWADSCAVQGHSMIERVWREKRRMVSRNIAIGGPLRRFAFKQMMAYETRNRNAS